MSTYNRIATIICTLILSTSVDAKKKCHPKYPVTSISTSSTTNTYEVTTPVTSNYSITTPAVTTSNTYEVTTPITSATTATSQTYVVTSSTPATTVASSQTYIVTSSTPATTVTSSQTYVVTSSTPVTTTTSSQTYATTSISTTTTTTVPPSYPTSSPGSNTFNGITYSPYTTGSCLNLEQIEAQLKAVAGYTNNIRLYGADCNQVENVLKAIVKNNLDIKVLLGVWTREGEARYQNEISTIVKVLQNASYRSIVVGVTVGNEEVFHGQSCASVCKYVNSARAQLTSSGISGLPVSTVDVYKSWDTELINCSDIVYANIYPFFTAKYGDGSISTAVNGLFTELDVMKKKYSISKEIRISESGWATDGTGAVTFGPANVENQCEFLTQFQCQAKKHQYPYYIMEAYDAPWKGGESCEKHFGIFGADSKLKCKSFTPTTC